MRVTLHFSFSKKLKTIPFMSFEKQRRFTRRNRRRLTSPWRNSVTRQKRMRECLSSKEQTWSPSAVLGAISGLCSHSFKYYVNFLFFFFINKLLEKEQALLLVTLLFSMCLQKSWKLLGSSLGSCNLCIVSLFLLAIVSWGKLRIKSLKLLAYYSLVSFRKNWILSVC